MIDLSRRSLALGLTALGAAVALPGAAAARRSAPPPPQLSIARRKVGAVEVTAISDGFNDLPVGVFTGAPPAEIGAALRGRFAPGGDGTIRLGFTVWLVDDGERLVLIDAGPGSDYLPTTGRLPAALATVGVRPEDIDAVLVTHMHFDHTAGLLRGDRPTFPNAELFLPRADLTHFTDAARAAAAPEHLKSSFATAERVKAAIPRLNAFDGERAITRAVSTVDLSGHTPGHTGYRIADGGQTLLIVGDALFDPALHPARSDIGIAFEADPAAAAAMRRRLFPRAAEERAVLAATHLPFPGIGRIVREGERLAWLPADWAHL